MDKIRVIVKNPGQVAEVREVENTLEALQELVEGWIEVLPMANGVYALVNEEGADRELPQNTGLVGYGMICGPIVLVGRDGDEFADVPRFMRELFEQ